MTVLGYDHLSSLPALKEPGSAPPLTGAAFLAHVAETGAEAVVATVLLEDDLHLRDSRLAGEAPATGEAEAAAAAYGPAVLTAEQVAGREPLPYPWSVADERHLVPGDGVWAAYYRHAADVADRQESGFLGAWVGMEVGLRNALATARARSLGLEAGPYQVVPELGRGGWDGVVAEWAAAPDPLAGLQVLIRARWRWLRQHDGWFTFSADELAAYAAGLVLLRRWQRVLSGKSNRVEGP